MKEYRVEVKVKNNYLWTLMQQRGFDTVPRLADAIGMWPNAIYEIMNLKVPLVKPNGEYTKPALLIAKFFNVPPDALAPSRHMEIPLRKNVAAFEASFEDVSKISAEGIPTPLLEDQISSRNIMDKLGDVLGTLTEREIKILRYRFGMDSGDAMTYDQIGKLEKVTRERIRQIEAKALRKLRSKDRAKDLREALTGDPDFKGNLPLDLGQLPHAAGPMTRLSPMA